MRRKVYFDVITRRDAKALRRWWSRIGVFDIERSERNPRFWCLVRR